MALMPTPSSSNCARASGSSSRMISISSERPVLPLMLSAMTWMRFVPGVRVTFQVAVAFAVFGFALEFLVQKFLDFAADGLHLRRAEAGAQHKILGERTKAAQVEYGDSGSFFVLHRFDGEADRWGKLFQIHLYRPCLTMYSSTRAETSP